ncbi:Gfo/Idh/MocA family protein [Yoonia litorea]|uniref:Predicted dehydrogenase n=1 Tax=Yoonia litorea TaxID=1123755 RepID=A0A1I6L4D4_9RHOB|nr:Gfo/Idh/MocA family oxidoreductase [Yoonia litorea]SFR98306.1 Predicted dehydrogenase [Yoonia litorea]
MTLLRVACVGAGYFSQFHIDGWQRIPQVSLVGVCDLDIVKARQASQGAPAFDDLQSMLAETKPDLLDIVLPPSGHRAAVDNAINAGCKTIICQKPFGADLQDARAMVSASEHAGVQLIIHENFRFQPWYRAIKQSIDGGLIGDVLQATFRLRPGDGQGEDAYLSRQPYFREMPRFLIHETGVHFVDVFRYLFGDPTHVFADLRQVNPVIAGEDAGFVIFTHKRGVRAVLDANRNLDHAADNTRRTMGEALIEGTDGALSLTGDGAVHFRKFGAFQEDMLLEPNTFDGFGGDCTFALQHHVVMALEADRQPENGAQTYLRVLEIEAAIYASAESGCRVALA